jgi:hypothetical protein
MADMSAVVFAYEAKFGSVPMLAGLPADKIDKAVDLLDEATRDDKPFSDVAWFAALGLDPPPEDALV